MGMYDSFTATVKCPCGHEQEYDDIQSKDFDCLLDHLKQGERTDKYVERYFLESCSMLDQPNNTIDKARKKFKDRTKFTWDEKPDGSWSAYNKLGMSKSAFDGIHGMDFNCYTTCKGCKKWLEMTGHITDDVFTGVDVNKVGYE